MFFHLIDKLYIVNESSRPQKTSGILLSEYDSYAEDREVYPFIERLYISLSEGRVRNRMVTILIVPDGDFGAMLLDYCHVLGFGKEEFLLMKEHSDFCERYIEDTEKDVSVPSGVDVEWKEGGRNRVRHPEIFPAEFCINCLDKEWARKKYEYFRMYDLYARIKECQYEDLRLGKKASLQMIENNDQAIKRLYHDTLFLKAARERIDTSFLDISLEKYIETSPSLGYNRCNAWKYNFRLARHLKGTGYRIDRRNQHAAN